MGNDTLVNRTNGQIVDQDFLNIFNRVLQGDFMGRDSSGAPTAGQNLGTPTIPWGNANITNLILAGAAIDPTLVTAPPNKVVSGRVRSSSDFPDFIRPAGSGNGRSYTVFGSATSILIDVNGSAYTITTDITKGSLTLAPSTNNTCLIDDASLTGQDSSKNLGEDGTSIRVDTMGSEISAKVGQFVALKNTTSNEIMLCLVESTTKLSHARRGFFLDENGTPIERGVLNNNETLQLMSLGYIFADKDTTTVDTSYSTPVISGNQPASASAGDYWLDTTVQKWKRYDGALWQIIERTFIGYAVIDTADCIGARCEYFRKSYDDFNSCEVNLKDVDTMVSDSPDFAVSVNGELKEFKFEFTTWGLSDFESGVSRINDRSYWLYISDLGDVKISNKKPYDLRGSHKGFYHPYEAWRCVAEIYNATAEFRIVDRSDKILEQPIGSVIELAYDDANSVPESYIRTEGATLNRVAFSALFSRFGTVWNVGGEAGTEFRLPDDRGVVMRGLDGVRGLDPGRVFGSYQSDSLQYHYHNLVSTYLGGTGAFRGRAENYLTEYSDNVSVRAMISDTISGGGTTIRGGIETRVKSNTRIFAVKYK